MLAATVGGVLAGGSADAQGAGAVPFLVGVRTPNFQVVAGADIEIRTTRGVLVARGRTGNDGLTRFHLRPGDYVARVTKNRKTVTQPVFVRGSGGRATVVF
jgi:hypothetical protein